MAAISGQMGAATATRFRLELSKIKVFRRKANSAATEQTKSLDNVERSKATEPNPSPPKTTPVSTPTQQQTALSKAESQPQASPVANPMQRPSFQLKQQRPQPAPKNPGQNQQRDSSPPSQKQPTTSAPKTNSKSQPPRFTVTVNGKVFRGSDSVTLNKRIVCVDGVPVGQAKTVVVLGQPKTVQADGGVSQGRNQIVLTSR